MKTEIRLTFLKDGSKERETMNKIIITTMLGSFIPICFAQPANAAAESAVSDQVTIFQVALRCIAAPQIGCGGEAKPILLKLEREPTVREAWLNRTGTLIAVVWKSKPTAQLNGETQQYLESRLRAAGRDAAVRELQGESRDQALRELQSGHGWYRGAEVGRLSEEEAGIIAARLVRRVKTKTELANDKAERLERVLADAYRKRFAEENYEEAVPVLQIVGNFLDDKQIAILEQAIEKGVRPLPDEAQAANAPAQSRSPDRVSIFKVSLQCPAAPQIGCGSASKPILVELERDPAVEQAWLNRAGTLIAVVWKSQPNAQTQQELASRLRSAGCCASDSAVNEVQGEARNQALKEFQSGHGWYRSAEVDRLSEEEAGIIAARLVRRVEAKTTLPKNKAERLREALASALRKCFTEAPGQERLAVRQLAGDLLDEKQIGILEQAINEGVHPLPNES
jgi:hypothetical protein